MCTKFWLKNLKERAHSEDIGVHGRMTLKWIISKYVLGSRVD
jgi:hypothetical protein